MPLHYQTLIIYRTFSITITFNNKRNNLQNSSFLRFSDENDLNLILNEITPIIFFCTTHVVKITFVSDFEISLGKNLCDKKIQRGRTLHRTRIKDVSTVCRSGSNFDNVSPP